MIKYLNQTVVIVAFIGHCCHSYPKVSAKYYVLDNCHLNMIKLTVFQPDFRSKLDSFS